MHLYIKDGDDWRPLTPGDLGGGGGGGGGGDASAANQLTQTARLESILAKIIAAPATAANQALGLDGLAAISSMLPATLGAKAGNASLSVVPATDSVTTTGGRAVSITVSPTVSTSPAYAAGDVIGAKLTIANAARTAAGSGLVQSAAIACKSTQSPLIDVVLFSADPTASTFTDNAAFAVANADIDKVLGVAHVQDWTSLGTPSHGQAQQLAMPFTLAAGTALYAVMVARAPITLASTSDLALITRVLQD